MNLKIKRNNKIGKWIVSWDEVQSKSKTIRKVEFFNEEELAKKRLNELNEIWK